MIDISNLKDKEREGFLRFYGQHKAFKEALAYAEAKGWTVFECGAYGTLIKMPDGSWQQMPDFEERR